MAIWGYVVVFVISVLASIALRPEPPKPAPASLENLKLPTAEAGIPIPVVFGTVVVESPNIVWYGDLKYEPVYDAGSK